MSSYSFSHQFSQHWTGAPNPVRAAIVQELTDITDLLQTDTPFEDFVFSVHDLDAHLDELYDAHQIQVAENQRIAAELAEADRLAHEKKQAEEKKARIEAEAKKAAERQKQAMQNEADDNLKESVSEEKDEKSSGLHDQKDAYQQQNFESHDDANTLIQNAQVNTTVKTVSKSAKSAIDLSLQDAQLTEAHESMIQELEATIDDYLTEQMLQMSENLKSWLRTEVSRQLSETAPSTDTDNK